jgi:peptidoglycan glycosyltransferase
MSVPPRYLEPARRSRRRRRSRTRAAGPRFGGPPRRRRAVPWGGLLAVALVAGAVAGAVVVVTALRGDDGRDAVERFAAAWERGDHRAMHAELTGQARRRHPLPRFAAAYRRAAATATATGIEAGRPEEADGAWTLPVTVRTKAFGPVRGELRLRTGGDPARLQWTPALAFPGLREGQRLRRVSRAPRRAPLLARNGRLLGDSEGTPTALGELTGIAGEVGRAEGAQRRALVAAGFPADAPAGTSGLQRALDGQLRGTPGGTLLAGRRVLARAQPRPAPPVRSSIDPALTRAAQSALGGRFGAVAAVEPRTGEVLALAGIALDGLQPPGSTFKIMTVTAALEDGVARMSSRYPVQTGANAGGRFIPNSHDEACGGDLTESFAKSCNSVFAPMGARLGGPRLVDVSQRFGFNQPTGVPGAASASIPRQMTRLEAGESAIGQGRTLATALNMAVVGAVIANGGRRPLLTLRSGARPRSVPATTPGVAAQVKRLMVAVVEGAGATGGAAAVPGVQVAGKTGTSELGGDQPNDAWFVAFAPASRPRIAVGVLVVHGGFGGDTAAPIARQVLDAGL